jgi:hypothetical protein
LLLVKHLFDFFDGRPLLFVARRIIRHAALR